LPDVEFSRYTEYQRIKRPWELVKSDGFAGRCALVDLAVRVKKVSRGSHVSGFQPSGRLRMTEDDRRNYELIVLIALTNIYNHDRHIP